MLAMDEIDQAIVRLLERHGRLSQEQLARRVRLSRPAVHQRVKRLEAAGVQATMTTLALSSLRGPSEATT